MVSYSNEFLTVDMMVTKDTPLLKEVHAMITAVSYHIIHDTSLQILPRIRMFSIINMVLL